MKHIQGYYDYIEGVRNGSIIAGQYIKQQVERLERLKEREDIFFDEKCVEECFEFIYTMKHFSGKAAGKNFELMGWQKWVIGSVIGIKHKESGLRVCRELFVLVARKNGKSSLLAALELYLLICDKEASPSMGIVASSKEQARIMFEMIQNYSKTLDPKGTMIKNYRNYLKFLPNNGTIKVFSSDSDRLDGLNLSSACLDEWHAQKDNKLYSVCKSSMGFRESPLMVSITTAGFLKEGYPCYEMYKVSIEILSGVKEQDEFFPFLYMLDQGDDWRDESVWVKSNPCIDETVSRKYLRDQVQCAANDPTQIVPICTKNFNMWADTAEVWIPDDKVVKVMKKLDIEDFRGCIAYAGIDLASVSDLSALSVLIPKDDKFYFFNWGFVPRETYKDSPNRELYQHFSFDGDLYVTEGNVTDYLYITNKIVELSQILNFEGIYYDQYNASQTAIELTNMGYNMHPIAQGLLSFTNPTKEFARLVLNEKAVINKSSMFLWCMRNCYLRQDALGNCKVDKHTNNAKIDCLIAAIQCVAGYLKNPVASDFELISVY